LVRFGCHVTWAHPYESRARDLVVSLKFGGRPGLAKVAGVTLAGVVRCSEWWTSGDRPPAGLAVVPVPAAPLRYRRRGFDPGELVAAALARELCLPFERCLARRSDRRQVGRPRRDRLANPPRVRIAGSVPAAALLVDDVLTTGATVGACAHALRTAGCDRVRGAVFAHALGAAGAGA
jgi:predicted amidophosphoribosyltransferase